MSKINVFIQVQGTSGIIEAELPTNPTHAQLKNCLSDIGVELDDGDHIFLDESAAPIEIKSEAQVEGLQQGGRFHVSHCRTVEVTVQYLEKSLEEKFPPGARLRKVKAWAVSYFELDKKDAAEHVLKLCGSSGKVPTSDTPLNELIDKDSCLVCFDLVPEMRVEG